MSLLVTKLFKVILWIVILTGLVAIHFEGNKEEILRYVYARRISNNVRLGTAFNEMKINVSKLVELSFPELSKYGMENELYKRAILIESSKNLIIDSELIRVPMSTIYRGKWARYFYLVGIDLYYGGFVKEAEFFFVISARLAPYWSHFWIELGDYYSSIGDDDMAGRIGLFCMGVENMKNHCRNYFNDKGEWVGYDKVGFLRGEIIENIN